MSTTDIYGFVYRGELAQEALDSVGRRSRPGHEDDSASLDRSLSIDILPEMYLPRASRMARIFIAISVLENSVRDLIEKALLEELGAEWWTEAVSSSIRSKVESRINEEQKRRFHTQRGGRNLDYIDFGDLSKIIIAKWEVFEDVINTDQEWCKNVFSSIGQTRNVIMHGGEVDEHDVHRVGMAIRDWAKQVGV